MGNAAGVIFDRGSAHACSVAGIATMKGKLFDLIHLNKLIQANIAEADSAQTMAEFSRTALFALQIVKASCDVAVGVAGDLADLAGPAGKPFKALSAGYSGLTPAAEALGKTMAGQSVGAAGWTKAASAGALGAFKVMAPDNPYKELVELQKIKSDLVIDAVNSNPDKVVKDMGNYGAKVAAMTAKAAENKKLAAAINVSKRIVGAGQDYLAAYREFAGNDMNATFEGTKRSFKSRQLHIQQLIRELETEISYCQIELAKSQAAPPKAANLSLHKG